jgi:hypothetical protein
MANSDDESPYGYKMMRLEMDMKKKELETSVRLKELDLQASCGLIKAQLLELIKQHPDMIHHFDKLSQLLL